MKGAILHNFNIHDLCDESYCNIMHRRIDLWRMWYFFDYLCKNENYVRCFSTEIFSNMSPPSDPTDNEINNKRSNRSTCKSIHNSEYEMTLLMFQDAKVSDEL
jgi:hypothetical protein